jgi:hypothetical protein
MTVYVVVVRQSLLNYAKADSWSLGLAITKMMTQEACVNGADKSPSVKFNSLFSADYAPWLVGIPQ